MARGRMFSKSYSTSARRVRLFRRFPAIAEFADGLYPKLISHADDFGRQQGDVPSVRLCVDPVSLREDCDFFDALVALHRVNLIIWFEVGGRQVVQIVDFDDHQTGLHKRTRSKFPESSSGKFPEIPHQRTNEGTERTEQNRTKNKELPPGVQAQPVENLLKELPALRAGTDTHDEHDEDGGRLSAALRGGDGPADARADAARAEYGMDRAHQGPRDGARLRDAALGDGVSSAGPGRTSMATEPSAASDPRANGAGPGNGRDDGRDGGPRDIGAPLAFLRHPAADVPFDAVERVRRLKEKLDHHVDVPRMGARRRARAAGAVK